MPAIVQPIAVGDESPLLDPSDRAGLRRFAVLAVRYLPARSEAYSQSRSARRETDLGTGVGGAIGWGAGVASCATLAWIPQAAALCVVATGVFWGGVGAVAGGNLANSIARDQSTGTPVLGAHVTVAASLLRPGNVGVDELLREQVRLAAKDYPGKAVAILDIQPHPAVEVDYRKFASKAADYDAIIEMTVLGLYLVGEAPGDVERFVLPVRVRVVRMSDLKILADTVLMHSTEERSADEWRRHDATELRSAIGEASRVVGQRIVSQLFVGRPVDDAPR